MPRAVPAGRAATAHTTDIPAGRASDTTANDAQTTRSVAAAAPAQRADRAVDGYTELVAETELAAEREREQPALFDAQPTAVAVAAAQPLHTDDSASGRGTSSGADRTDPSDRTDESTTEDSAPTVSQAARQAEIIAKMQDKLTAGAAKRARALLAAHDLDED